MIVTCIIGIDPPVAIAVCIIDRHTAGPIEIPGKNTSGPGHNFGDYAVQGLHDHPAALPLVFDGIDRAPGRRKEDGAGGPIVDPL